MENTSKDSKTKITKCKICCQTQLLSQLFVRYPNLVCNECEKKAVDKEGNVVKYYNVDISGGFVSHHYVPNSDGNIEITHKNNHECWIDGVKCYAEEARFGGIVVQVVK